MSNGDPYLVIAPYDADGNFCGKTAGYEDYPYLWYQNLEYATWSPWAVCVKECPTEGSPTPECKLAGSATTCEPKPEPYDSYLFLDLYCFPDYDSLPISLEDNYDNMIGSFGIDDIEVYVRDI